ncbi:MAG: alcohol dehydrogenase catalytic domain-containing protein [Bryobacteraceae bacterium]
MRSIQLVGPRTLEEREMPMAADPGLGEVLVKVQAVGICGSDLHWYLDSHIGRTQVKYPQVLGHEPVGEILAVGKEVHAFHAGDRVVLEPTLSCGHCEYCRAGRHNNCASSVFLGGPQLPGFFREYVTLPAHNAIAVPASFSNEQATLVEPLAVMMHILELIDVRLGDTVAILGAGPIGMLCAAMVRSAGASRVFIGDRVPHRLAMARKMGADAAINTGTDDFVAAVMDQTRGRGVDLAFEAVGNVDMINTALRVARPSGTVVLIGITPELNPAIEIDLAMSKELRIQAVKRSNHRSQAAIDLIASGQVPAALITHRLALSETGKGFEMLANYSDGVGKVVIETGR